MRWPNVASTTTVTMASGCSSVNAITASLSWARLGIDRPSVAMLDPSTTTTFVGAGLGWGHGVYVVLIVVSTLGARQSAPTGCRAATLHRRVAARDPSGTVGLRRRDPLQPVRGVPRYEAGNGLPLDFIRCVNATNPRRQRVGPAGARRARPRRVRRRVRRRVEGARPRGARRRRAGPARRRRAPGDGAGARRA